MFGNNFNKRIGKNIRSIRKAQNITQEQLAEKVGTTYQAISKIERGVHPPTVEKLFQICEFINASPNEIIYGDSEWKEWREESAFRTNYSLKGLNDLINIGEDMWAQAEINRMNGDEKGEEFELDRIIQMCLKGTALKFYQSKFLASISGENMLESLRKYADAVYHEWINQYIEKMLNEVRDNKINNLKIGKNKEKKK